MNRILAIAIAIPVIAGLYVLLSGSSSADRDQSSSSTSQTEVEVEVEKKMALEITAENFEELVTDSEQPVVVDFWASWCAPCMMLSSHVEEIANEYQGKAVVGKVNVDEQPELAKRFEADPIPLVLIFKDGEIVERIPEFKPETPDMIREAIDRLSP